MIEANDQSPAVKGNDHIRDYLRYYFSFPHSPRYAVLLNGTWGIGKTYLIERLLEEMNKDEVQYCYVSLFGASSMADIDDALLRAIHPYIFSKVSKIAGHAVKAAVSYFKITSTIDIVEFVDKFKAKIYIFDDLERCEMPINKVMGYINSFVEHEGCKVVIIAHEGQIPESDRVEYWKRREKIVGKTFEVQASTDEALAHFITKIDNAKVKNFALEHKTDIISVYDKAEINNLRILQQSIWDFERFYACIPDDLATKSEGLTFILRFFLAFSFEVKKSRVSAGDLESVREVRLSGQAA
ncbi:P-loop NTPase fold protein [Methylobacterium radiotolerans]|uniref:P-loop NTPase fold protein n=1 Tax=Methylobacterium radiotolerans TaxID=31998 RepID=UPI000D5F8A54|nr:MULTISPECIES: P-loop NTPase fold protein [Methylobacterium]MDE3748598.1 P-loop NTPase fold protein [Methylobacterium radiotolerans]PVY93686.1 KAP-like P-loop domain-containing protein [Methylobacterium organophilum]